MSIYEYTVYILNEIYIYHRYATARCPAAQMPKPNTYSTWYQDPDRPTLDLYCKNTAHNL